MKEVKTPINIYLPLIISLFEKHKMKKAIIILSAFALIASSCGQSTKKQSKSEQVNKQEEWNFIINPPNVGLISTKNYISEIPDLLPINYSMVKDSTVWNNEGEEDKDKWEYTTFYAVREDNTTIFKIYPGDNKNEIASVVVLSPEYKIRNTELRVGSTLGTLKKTFSIKDRDFSFDSGLFIFCNEFNGAFSIDLEREGHLLFEGENNDDPDSFGLLPDSKKIDAIIVYR